MGHAYLFQCSKCGYAAKIAGGAAGGLNCFVQTIHCQDCRELYDVATHIRLPDTLALKTRVAAAKNRFPRLPRMSPDQFLPAHVTMSTELLSTRPSLPEGILLPEGAASNWVSLAMRCPAAHVHRIESWQDPGRCPKCGSYLDKSLIPFRIWD